MSALVNPALPVFSEQETEQAIQKFIELVRIPTVSNTAALDGSYQRCADFLVQELNAAGLGGAVLDESVPNKPIVVGEWLGSEPALPAILLNSHYDVVPVVADAWRFPAFEGVREQGKVYGRGTQDMKCVCIQYILALAHLRRAGFTPVRTLLLSFVPDEEVGGADGMNVLMSSAWFKARKIDLALDEGLASTDSSLCVFYGERLPWWVKVTAKGNTGHGSRFVEGTAVEQVVGVVNRALAFRKAQKDLLHGAGRHAGCSHAVAKKRAKTLGDVTTLNVTMLRAGVQAGGQDVLNVVPPAAEAGLDIRISPHTDPKDIAREITTWCHEVEDLTGGLAPDQGLSWSFINEPSFCHATTPTTAEANVWWKTMHDLFSDELGIDIVPQIFPAATDSRFLRAMGLKAFGFSPMRNTKIMLHEHDEFIEEAVFVEGCKIYVKLLERLASQA